MVRFLLEDVWKLVVLWGVVQFLLICLLSWTRARRIAIANWVVLAIIPLLSSLSILIETPAEQIIETCRRVARAIDDGNMEAIGSHISSDFDAENLDRAAMLQRLESALTRVRIDNPRLRAFEIIHTGDDIAEATFLASCRVRTPEFTRNSLPSKWRIRFGREGDTWRMIEIESLPIPPLNYRVLGDWVR